MTPRGVEVGGRLWWQEEAVSRSQVTVFTSCLTGWVWDVLRDINFETCGERQFQQLENVNSE